MFKYDIFHFVYVHQVITSLAKTTLSVSYIYIKFLEYIGCFALFTKIKNGYGDIMQNAFLNSYLTD